MRVQLKSRPEWNKALAEQNGVKLLIALHALHHKQDDTQPSMWEIIEQDRQLYLCTQKQKQSDIEYLKAFQNAVDAINKAGG